MKRIWTSFFPLLLCATLSAGCANTTSGDAKPKYADFRAEVPAHAAIVSRN